jgi:hypothetical protein
MLGGGTPLPHDGTREGRDRASAPTPPVWRHPVSARRSRKPPLRTAARGRRGASGRCLMSRPALGVEIIPRVPDSTGSRIRSIGAVPSGVGTVRTSPGPVSPVTCFGTARGIGLRRIRGSHIRLRGHVAVGGSVVTADGSTDVRCRAAGRLESVRSDSGFRRAARVIPPCDRVQL